jgi:hypothetical protein
LLNEIDKLSYHAKGNNTNSIGIVLIGNYEVNEPSEKMLVSFENLINAHCENLDIVSIVGHKDAKFARTLCPGKNAHKKLAHLFYQ